MFIISLHYIKSIAEVEKFLPAHREYLKNYYASGHFICSGPKKPREGGIILCNTENQRTLNKILTHDPFFREQVAEFEITEFTPTMYNEAFAHCLR